MMVGPKHQKLEKRISRALLSGKPYPREAVFLHQTSERLLHRGREMHLSQRQAEHLFAILARCEGTVASSSKSAKPPAQHPPSTHPISPPDKPTGFNLSEAIEPSPCPTPISSIQHPALPAASTLPMLTNAPKTILTRAPSATPLRQSPPADHAKTQEPDFRNIVEQVLARNEARRQGKPEPRRVRRFPSS